MWRLLGADCGPARTLATVPEVGPGCAATLVAELGTPADVESRARFSPLPA